MIPENFFNVLAAPGKVAYWDCILRIFDITSSQLSYGVERDILVDDLEYYFSSTMSADLQEEDTGSMTPRDKANFMLRRLESCGWITVDVDHSYVQRVNFRDYAIDIIKTLKTITEGKKVEYQGYIYTIYNLCRAKDLAGVGLLEIVKNTDALITSLKSLNANIKNYIDDLTKHSSVAEILDALLNDYYTNVVDKAYHRLLASDNVSKFRPVIVGTLEKYSKSPKFLSRAASEVAQIRELSEEEAKEQVLTMLHVIYPDAVFSHFGDVDAGGFRIWKNLCLSTGLEISTLHMDEETYLQYLEYGKELTEHDRRALKRMSEDPFFKQQKHLFQVMLAKNRKLEQECIV